MWIVPKCNDCHMCEANAQCLTAHCEYVGAMRVQAGVRDGRPRSSSGQCLHPADGDQEAEQEPDFIPALYCHVYFLDFLSPFHFYSH